MRYLIILALTCIAQASFGQQGDVYKDFQQQFQRKTIKPAMPDLDALIRNRIKISAPSVSANKIASGIMLLQQDNMPCVVPDMSVFNMPNASMGNELYPALGAIPNPAPKVVPRTSL